MTRDEKIAMVHGVEPSPYTGRIPANPRLCIPELNLQDGPAGVRMSKTTAFPAPLTVAASRDTNLMEQYGVAIGTEVIKGANVLLAPMMNIDRAPQAGP